ncbi:carbohydrate kinase family protein [Candidatus Uhrbacteria bacterium]|nr:carbohydrate kinase family protein [Candidatus Uhrbacteria bacterium]
MPTFNIITVGAATQDVFVKSKKFEEMRDPHAPDGLDACVPLGSKIDVDDLIFSTGGGATNSAVTFARLGFKTACISRIGQDPVGEMVLSELKKEKIATVGIEQDGKLKTGYSIIFLSGSGHRAILTHRGAAAEIKASALANGTINTPWIYLTSLNGNLSSLKTIFSSAKRKRTSVAWNPGHRELELGIKKLRPWLEHTSILILNREEAALLTEQSPRHLESIFKILQPFLFDALVITDGQRGAYVSNGKNILFAPALKAKRINTTGAGDAFGSAFTAALIKERSIEDAVKIAMLNATGVITHMGAKAGILKKWPTRNELNKVKIKKL